MRTPRKQAARETSTPRIGQELSVDRWEPPLATEAEGGHWETRILVWDGERYQAQKVAA